MSAPLGLAVGRSIESVVLDEKAIGAERCDGEMVATRRSAHPASH